VHVSYNKVSLGKFQRVNSEHYCINSLEWRTY